MRDYLQTLSKRLAEQDVRGTLDIMLSDGAFTRADIAAEFPIRILESGPAGGVQSAVNCGLDADTSHVLAFDMGTTAKACVAVDGKPAITHVFEFGRVRRFKQGSGLPAMTPSMDLIEIGAGGGSLATVNALGLLQVGPQSAGSELGPACYGRGGEQATVTDADLVLGYLDADRFWEAQCSWTPHGPARRWKRPAANLTWTSRRPPGASTISSTRTWPARHARILPKKVWTHATSR